VKALRTLGRWVKRAIELAVIFCLAGSISIAGFAIAADLIAIPRF